LIDTTARVAGSSLFEASSKFGSDLYIYGVIALSQGFLLSSMLFAAILVFIIEKDFRKASLWSLVAAALSLTGVIHAFELTPFGVQNKFGLFAAPSFAAAYGLGAILLFLFHLKRPNA
jgi:AGZA family xanthine/uracil permease-like MFS transporter